MYDSSKLAHTSKWCDSVNELGQKCELYVGHHGPHKCCNMGVQWEYDLTEESPLE